MRSETDVRERKSEEEESREKEVREREERLISVIEKSQEKERRERYGWKSRIAQWWAEEREVRGRGEEISGKRR